MRDPSSGIDSVTRSAGAALLCGVLANGLSSRQSELCSEVLAWFILPVVVKVLRHTGVGKRPKTVSLDNSASQPPSTVSLWIVALGIASFCVFKAEIGMVGFFPALTPLLLVTQGYLRTPFSNSGSTMPDSWFAPFVNTVWGTTLTASFTTGTLLNWDFRAHFLSVIPVAALLAVCVTLTPRIDKSRRYVPPFDIENAIIPLSLRTVALLAIALGAETTAFGFFKSNAIATLIQAFAKASSWYFVFQTAQLASWNAAIATGTFSIISTRNPFKQSSGALALLRVAASFLVLGQVIHMLPKQARAKSVLWAFFVVSCAPYLANILAIRIAESSLIRSQGHPVEVLIQSARTDFEKLCQRQSKNFEAAQQEYRRRYNYQPPPGFEGWYEYATLHQSPIIDEFDVLYDGISPFWKLSGEDFLDIMNYAHNVSNAELWLCTFSGQQAEIQCNHPQRKYDRHIQVTLNRLLGNLRGVLPDVKFYVNHLDEPRVILPQRSLTELGGIGGFNLTNLSKKPVWDTLTKFCSSEGNMSSAQDEHTVNSFILPFVTDLSSAMDLCRHPEYSSLHGLAISPTSFRLLEGFVPVLSTGAPSTMGDILFPSPAYAEPEFQYDDARDVEWDQKRNNLYWAGSTTGGFALDDQWQNYHRHRFVSLAQNLDRRQHSYLRERGGVVSRVKSTFLNSRLFDVAFTKIFQCERRFCRNQHAYFNVKSWADKDQAFRSRLVFDVDGNGISGRYYKLLASKSTPLKQTLFREWHDDRLMPWVHYIPVSQSMEELPELVLYLTSTEAGQKRAREIAMQGRDWFSKSFREVDMTIYMYRLLLELARLQDPKRLASPAGESR